MADRDGDKPKKSWRDIDAKRDRSSGGGSSSGSSGGGRDEPRGGNRAQADRASKQYRAALEALFDKGGIGKVADKLGASSAAPGAPATPARTTAPAPTAADAGRAALRKKIVEAIGRDAITRAVNAWLKDGPIPEDYEVLEQVVEHRDDDRVREALGLLEAMLGRDKPKRTRVLGAKLRHIEETSDDRELREHAARVRARLG